MSHIIQNFRNYQNDPIFKKQLATKIKLIRGNTEKILDLYFPKISLYELFGKSYTEIISTDNDEEIITYTINETCETFDGFERFITDYVTNSLNCHNNFMQYAIDIYALNSAVRFGMENFYTLDENINYELFNEYASKETREYILSIYKTLAK